ncbi:MAG: hypothetical protein DRP08_01355 [Candidatus Aenigmatarchaeota archaeon]|nr:MAG: hypothetical protein DRP08_01355 [Candidatus Aenigmarchaeota archaeon]
MEIRFDGRWLISFNYDPQIIKDIKTFANRQWNPFCKEWEVFCSVEELIPFLEKYKEEIELDEQAQKQLRNEKTFLITIDFDKHTEEWLFVFPYAKEIVEDLKKSFYNRYWNQIRKRWEVDASTEKITAFAKRHGGANFLPEAKKKLGIKEEEKIKIP